MKKRNAILALFATAAVASAALISSKVTVSLAGKSVTVDSVVVGGKTYVSLDQLKAQLNAKGGANQLGATEGIQNEWLFNGVWRLRVSNVAWNSEQESWDVTVELRNGYKSSLKASDAGFAFNGSDGFFLTIEDGNTVEPFLNAGSDIQDAIGYKSLPPGGGSIIKIPFRGTADKKPVKLLVEFKPKAGFPLVKDPSFRIDLTKSK